MNQTLHLQLDIDENQEESDFIYVDIHFGCSTESFVETNLIQV